jgi:hypothetical protein
MDSLYTLLIHMTHMSDLLDLHRQSMRSTSFGVIRAEPLISSQDPNFPSADKNLHAQFSRESAAVML